MLALLVQGIEPCERRAPVGIGVTPGVTEEEYTKCRKSVAGRFLQRETALAHDTAGGTACRITNTAGQPPRDGQLQQRWRGRRRRS